MRWKLAFTSMLAAIILRPMFTHNVYYFLAAFVFGVFLGAANYFWKLGL